MIISSPSDYREAARRKLPPFLFHYIDGGAYAEQTVATVHETAGRIGALSSAIKPIAEGMKAVEHIIAMMQRAEEPDEDVLGDGVALAGVAAYPARVKCALLSWMAWKDAAIQATGEGA